MSNQKDKETFNYRDDKYSIKNDIESAVINYIIAQEISSKCNNWKDSNLAPTDRPIQGKTSYNPKIILRNIFFSLLLLISILLITRSVILWENNKGSTNTTSYPKAHETERIEDKIKDKNNNDYHKEDAGPLIIIKNDSEDNPKEDEKNNKRIIFAKKMIPTPYLSTLRGNDRQLDEYKKTAVEYYLQGRLIDLLALRNKMSKEGLNTEQINALVGRLLIVNDVYEKAIKIFLELSQADGPDVEDHEFTLLLIYFINKNKFQNPYKQLLAYISGDSLHTYYLEAKKLKEFD